MSGVGCIVCCLYCGKVIGAFRLLRDSEFCSALHRMKYGERLGKALHEIAAPEPAPAGVAGFLDQMPLQQGNLRRSSNQWQTVGARNRIRTGTRWPLTIDTSEAIGDAADDAAGDTPSAAAAAAQCAPVEGPPSSQRWMNAPPPEQHTSELQSPMYLVCRLLLEKS